MTEEDRPEPDAWRLMWSRTKDEIGNYQFERTLLFPEAFKEYRELDCFDERSKNITPLYSRSTVQEAIDNQIEKLENEHGEMSDYMASIHKLRELKEVFDGE